MSDVIEEAAKTLEKMGYKKLATQLRDLPATCPEECDCACRPAADSK